MMQIILIALLAGIAAGGLVWFGWGVLERAAAARERKAKKAA